MIRVSNQHQKDCNFYIEGCGGGLPINVAKWGWEFGLVDEQCYDDSLNEGQSDVGEFEDSHNCNYDLIHNCPSDQTYFVDDYYYIGGNYGGITERDMMRELLAHGPVTVVTEVPAYLGSYSGGIIINECPTLDDEISEYLRDGTESSRLQMRVRSRASIRKLLVL